MSATETPIRLGVAGLGYWGPNLARNFATIPGCELTWLCDADPAARERVARAHPSATATAELDDLLGDPSLDAVVLATPVPTHADLAVRVLQGGKHCFVEKPLATTVADARRAVDAATEAHRILMVGHLLEYHPGVRALKELTDSGELGEEIFYIYGNRLNLGKLRADENALWSLGAHDVSVVLTSPRRSPSRSPPTAPPTCATASRTSSSAFCGSPPAWSPTCTCPGSIPIRSGASPSSAPSAWRRSTTWRSSAS